MACQTCRARKIKCDRTRPVCQNCELRSSRCTYAGERRIRRSTDAGILSNRPALAGLGQFRLAGGSHPHPHHALAYTALDMLTPSMPLGEKSRSGEPWRQPRTATAGEANTASDRTDGAGMTDLVSQPRRDDTSPDSHTPASSEAGCPETLLDKIFQGTDVECLEARNPAIWIRAPDGDEYTGPSSGISAISDLGLQWIRDHVLDSDGLCDTIQDIRNGLLTHLRQPKCIPPGAPLTPGGEAFGPKPILPSQVARYVEAYFSTVQTIFPILDRAEFESQLEILGTSQDCTRHSWKALLNAVLASGCRAALSDETANAFQESGRESWGFFQNALSYESKIIHGATDLMAVQAVAVMTVFAQGLSTPQRLEYTLSSIASRLAQSLALNRQPYPAWDLSEREKRERNRVFWVIYCLDKTVALRCGRPSAIHDDEISCSFPRDVQVGYDQAASRTAPEAAGRFDFFLCFTKLARICGEISRRLYSTTALSSASAKLSSTLYRILQDLDTWRQSIPPELQPGKPLGRITETRGLSRAQLLVLHTSYCYVLCSVYRRFTPLFTQGEDPNSQLLTPRMAAAHIEAARSIALLTKHFDVESFTPGWLGFYYPMTALTTIFVHVVTNPCDESTQNDIALMEVVVGFFGRVEYVTSGEAAFTKTTEFVRQARRVAERFHSASQSTSPDGASPGRLRRNGPEDAARTEPMSLDVGSCDLQKGGGQDPLLMPGDVLRDGSGFMLSSLPAESIASLEQAMADAHHRRVDIADNDDLSSHHHPLYTDVMGLLASPPSEISSQGWLGAWASTEPTAS